MLTGKVNSKNCVHWTDSHPHDAFSTPLHDEKVTVWCGITCTFILGLNFLEEITNGDLQTYTVTSARYLDILARYTIPELQRQNALS